MKLCDYLKEHVVYLDGGMGTLLQARGLLPGELPERWNLTHPEIITDIHRAYFDAGSNIVLANTFGASSLKFDRSELESIVSAAIANARRAAEQSRGTQPRWVALDIGPSGRMLRPYGDLDFEDAVGIFAETVRLGVKHGADLVVIETMSDSYETKAALLAAKESCELPVFVCNAYGEDGRLMTGASPHAMIAMLEGMGADAIGVNCSQGPAALTPVVEEYLRYASVPVILKPNAGLPRVADGETVYDLTPGELAHSVCELVHRGVGIVGGCCGTSPEYIRAMVDACADAVPRKTERKNITCISSYTHAVVLGGAPVLIGERINPTGKARFKEALKAHDIDYILREGIAQQDRGAQVLDVNVGLPDIDEVQMLCESVTELQAVIDLPLQIDTSDPRAMEAALRRYNGKAMINSVNGKREVMDAVFPLVKKYGGVVVALTLDDSGIPESAWGRLAIAERILDAAQSYGIEKKDIIFDPLAMTVSADPDAAVQTLHALELIRTRLGAHTSLGVSNVSYGLPSRDTVNATFFALALGRGLSAAIMNPYSQQMMNTYYSYLALSGMDKSCATYIDYAESIRSELRTPNAPQVQKKSEAESTELQAAIVKGLCEQAARLTDRMLGSTAALDIVNGHIIPALNTVGVGFENKTVYLPQLLMSAEAASAAFEVIRASMPEDRAADKCTVVIATVKGDIHDIGKNIVRLILENYGFRVVDLGRDVAPERVVSEAIRHSAAIVGLSALMTTTVAAMEQTVKLLHRDAPGCRVLVGGAVLSSEYAAAIGADKYAKDAMEAVRYAEQINSAHEK